MAYTLGQAAKATGLNKATIFKALKSGKLSGEKDVHGRYVIDPAELHRVYPPVSENGEKSGGVQLQQTSNNGQETQFLREKVALLERLVEQITGERDRLLLLLPKPSDTPPVIQAPPPPKTETSPPVAADQPKTATPTPKPNRGILGRIFGRAA